MKLYGHPHSACTRKVMLTCAEKGHDLELIHLDLMAGEHNRPAHLARHPFAKIPVLEDGLFTLYESGAIIRYLDQRLFGTKLTPSSPREIGRMEQWLSVEPAYLAPAIWTLMYQLQVRPRFGEQADEAELARGRKETSHVLAVLDRELAQRADKGYLAGFTYSLADICFMPTLQFLEDAGEGQLIAAHAHTSNWWTRVSARPSSRKVLQNRAERRPTPAREVERRFGGLRVVAQGSVRERDVVHG
jgi:glutathione S-transferase